ncbi:integrin alpha-8-like [Amphiura filiformis]|uniref:integrin alpha-8-like n=1 Tax=Amphiura filiformis TaxID=82378 RepID=UPI003B2148EA
MDVKMILFLVVQLFLLTEFCTCFNVDTRAPVVHSGDLGTEFGFSVELHREQNTNWLLVGAPRAQTNQQGVDEGGAVFRCPVTPIDNPGQCTEIEFDTTGNPIQGNIQTGSKSNQRFGYTVESSGPDGPVVACAPLRLWYTPEGQYRYPVGGCFVARNDFNNIEEMTPCQTDTTSQWKKFGPVFCQAGMSAAINEDTLVMGGPGSIYWQGSLYVDYFSSSKTDPPPFTDTSSLDDSYRGYSVTFGEFNGDDMPDAAAGLPRAPDHKGQVKLYTTDLSILRTLQGEQVGSYFGHSLTAIDINGDNLDDLIVGAPMYIDKDRSLEAWEVGRVYVYFQDPSQTGNFPLSPNKVITGKRTRARFGFSVAAIGDMDRDGFNDFAVGAPYDGEDGTGAVYIFHGSSTRSFSTTPSQIVYPSDLGLGIGTFGYSLASGLDMDNNAYIDLLVGAYNSSTAVLLRSRPIVDINVEFTIDPEVIDLETTNKVLPDGTMVANYTIRTCITFTGPDVPDNLDLAFTLILDSQRPQTSRALFGGNDNHEISNEVRLTRDTAECLSEEAYIRGVLRDRKSPIGILINYNLLFNESNIQPGEILPILNQKRDSFAYQSVPLRQDCKNLNCLPDLKLTASTTTRGLIIGDDEPMNLDIAVSNDGEDAFETVFIATFPEGLQFVRVERKQQDVSVTCNEDVDNNQITCDLGNPFPESHQLLFGIKLNNVGLLGDKPKSDIIMQVRSASQELQNTTADNFANITIDVKAQAEITLAGVSDPRSFEFPVDETGNTETEEMITKEEDAGPEITHYYTLRNLGPSNIGPTSIDIKWPMWYSEGEYLLYLISATMGSGSIFEQDCEIIGGVVNPEGLTPEAPNNDTDVGGDAIQNNPRRKRRQTEEETQEDTMQYLVGFDCDSSPDRCYNISCVTDGLMASSDGMDSITIVIKSRLWLDTVSNIDELRQLSVTSMAEAKVQSMPYAIAPPQLPSETAEITLLVVPEVLIESTQTAIPWWVYIVAAVVGLFILCVLVLGLCRCGFFKRKQIQPSNNAMVSDDIWVADAIQTGTLQRNELRPDEH